jgi:hypothetical protein
LVTNVDVWPRVAGVAIAWHVSGVIRRRVKVIGWLLGEQSCLNLAWAALV